MPLVIVIMVVCETERRASVHYWLFKSLLFMYRHLSAKKIT